VEKAAAAYLVSRRAARTVSAAGSKRSGTRGYFEDRPSADSFMNEPFPNGYGYVVSKKRRIIADEVLYPASHPFRIRDVQRGF
jgi:hypothetical protein